MTYKNEKIILKLIKYTPPIFIISISSLLILFLYFEYKNTYLQEKKLIEKEFVDFNKKLIKNNVDIVYNTITEMQKNTEEKLKKSIKERVYEAYAIATRIYNENKNTKDKKTITKMIKDALVDIRFNDGRGYYYIYSFDYECILFPLKRTIEGKNFYNFKDIKGKYLTRDIISQLKEKNEGFMNWYFYKPNDRKKSYRKIGFNKYFEPLDWFIGTGEYLYDFEKSVKKEAFSYIKTLKYLNNNYIFVLDYDGRYLNHIRHELIGKSAIKKDGANDVKNSSNVFFKALNIIKKDGEGYLTYIQNKKPITGETVKKTSFIKGVEKWKIFIGQGFYEDEYKINLEKKRVFLENKFKEYVFSLIISSILLIFILLVISLYFSKILQKRFESYKEEISEHIEDNNRQHKILAHQSKMIAMGEMISNIAHQWRQPLSVITTVASGLRLNNEAGILKEKEINDSMDLVVNEATHLSIIIEDFRNFLNSNQEKTCFTMEKVINQAITLAYGEYGNIGIKIIKDIEDIEVHNFENQFIQFLINFFKNSDDAFEKNGIEEKLIFIVVKKVANYIHLTIEDNGGGIEEENLSRIFEPYFTTKHQYQGTGMGLYMCEEIITKLMSGTIDVFNGELEYEGEIYKSTKFFIKIPLTNK